MSSFIGRFLTPVVACVVPMTLVSMTLVSMTPASVAMAEGQWRADVLPVELGVGYAVLMVDVNGDGNLDIAIVDSKRFLWMENPTWQTHVMLATPEASNDNVCFAPNDVDGDGRVDFAVGHDWQVGNTDSGGKIGWIKSPQDPRAAWTYYPIAEEPTTHRMRWIDWDHDGSLELVVAPLKGRGSRPPDFLSSGIRLLAFSPDRSQPAKPWGSKVIDESLHVSHNLDVVDLDRDNRQELLLASFEGVTHLKATEDETTVTKLGEGQQGTAPAIGSSEVRLGTLGSGKRYLATIEPWHGDHVVAYTEPDANDHSMWSRFVLDEQLKWGHAVACANLDSDADQELIIGVRDDAGQKHRCGVRIYDPTDAESGIWKRRLIEPGQVAVEDLAVGDLDNDGDVDIVAVGRATHNAVVYWNE